MKATAEAIGLEVQVVPRLDALISGRFTLQPREIDVRELLPRPPVRFTDDAVERLLRDKVVLVTGAAGSIGSEICRQIIASRPRRLILLDISENGLFFLARELAPARSACEIVHCIASITDAAQLRAVFSAHEPDIVFHAAAHKHVGMMESNPGEAVKNNVIGTRILVDEVIHAGVEAFVLISTDKAVRPTSIMGVCKRLGELYVQSRAGRTDTRLITVRFGNVLGSNGSVVPIFREQIARADRSPSHIQQ